MRKIPCSECGADVVESLFRLNNGLCEACAATVHGVLGHGTSAPNPSSNNKEIKSGPSESSKGTTETRLSKWCHKCSCSVNLDLNSGAGQELSILVELGLCPICGAKLELREWQKDHVSRKLLDCLMSAPSSDPLVSTAQAMVHRNLGARQDSVDELRLAKMIFQLQDAGAHFFYPLLHRCCEETFKMLCESRSPLLIEPLAWQWVQGNIPNALYAVRFFMAWIAIIRSGRWFPA